MRTSETRSWLTVAMLTVATLVPSAARAQQARSYLVNIDSQPAGATVRLDAVTASPLGSTPLQRVRLPRGPHTLYFTLAGYIDGHVDVNVTRPRDSFTIALQQAGSIYVAADVDGAQVYIDGVQVGTTPGRINGVQPGQHVVEIRQPGMNSYRDTITVGTGAVASVNATIRPPPPSPPPTGIVRVIVSNPNGPSPADLSVSFDGSPMTGQPPTVDNAGPGTHIVQISANGFRTIRREVTVTAGQTFALAVDLDPIVTAPTGGNVRVIVPTQGAQVYLDGEVISNPQGGPASRDNVPAGTHSVRVTAANRETVTREIQVTAGQATNIELPDLTAVAQVGMLRVVSQTPNAHVFVDGHDMGPSPYENAAFEAGQHTITVRAQGYDDRNETCTVATGTACDLTLPLSRTVGHAQLHVEMSHPFPGATLLIDGNGIGEIGAGRDVPNITATTHEIRVQSQGFEDYVESITLQENEQHRTIVTLHRSHRGPSGQQLAARRSAISTWGASPLSRGDVAVDIMGAYGEYPVQIRGTTGLIDYGPAGIDAGFAIRSMGTITEIELRARAGYRALDGLLAFGAEVRPFAGLGFAGQSNVGVSAWAEASLHSLTPQSDDAGESDDPNERANQFGSFALSIHVGFEAMHDGLNGMNYRDFGSAPTGGNVGIPACSEVAATSTNPGNPNPCGFLPVGSMNTRMDTMGNVFVTNGSQNLLRAIAGVTIEFGISRHVNFFAGVDRVISDTSITSQRAYYESLWGSSDSFTYVRAGLTYKF